MFRYCPCWWSVILLSVCVRVGLIGGNRLSVRVFGLVTVLHVCRCRLLIIVCV